jgi:hypothetical protein
LKLKLPTTEGTPGPAGPAASKTPVPDLIRQGLGGNVSVTEKLTATSTGPGRLAAQSRPGAGGAGYISENEEDDERQRTVTLWCWRAIWDSTSAHVGGPLW